MILVRLMLVVVLLAANTVFADQQAEVAVPEQPLTTLVPEAVVDGGTPKAVGPVSVSKVFSAKPSPLGGSVVSADPFTVVFSLLFIVLLIFGLAWMVRRLGSVSALGNQSLKVVAGLSVGTREKVVLIEVGGQQVLVGVAPGRVSHLCSFDHPVVNTSVTGGSDFTAKIKKLLQSEDSRGAEDK